MFTAALPIAYAMTSDYREQWDRSLCPLRDIRYKKLTFTRCVAAGRSAAG
ncbi:hypothetical protein SMATCC274_05110 [Serratia marcescens]|nr:hypothetical protein SMATCC274_05110 [Serratia marcescens]